MRGIVISDTHCGHHAGLTPPGWMNTERHAFGKIQRQCWEFYINEAQRHGPYDFLIHNGDAIDGNGKKSGGTEQITTDRQEQANMAVECIKAVVTPKTKIVMTYGTGYHTGNEEDFEKQVAEKVGAVKIGSHEWLDIEGTVFDCKHHIGSSTIPYGRHAAVAKERMWNLMWEKEIKDHPKGDVYIRSHVHYYNFEGGAEWLGMTTPALQAFGSKYGSRRCSGTVNYGFVVFNVNKEGYTWKPCIAQIKAQVPTVVKL